MQSRRVAMGAPRHPVTSACPPTRTRATAVAGRLRTRTSTTSRRTTSRRTTSRRATSSKTTRSRLTRPADGVVAKPHPARGRPPPNVRARRAPLPRAAAAAKHEAVAVRRGAPAAKRRAAAAKRRRRRARQLHAAARKRRVPHRAARAPAAHAGPRREARRSIHPHGHALDENRERRKTPIETG